MVPIQNSIYMLNEDVLRVVFEFVANIDSPRFMRAKRPLPSSYSLGWIYLSHVCSSWRTISLSMRDLWARDALTIPSALDTFLSRAGKRPLSFELPYILNWDFPPYTNMIECAFDHIHRMEALRSHAPLSWDRYVVLDDATLPLLRTLDITCQSAVFIQKNIHINAPALEIAKVRGMPITFSAPKLRELRLNCPPEPSSALLDMLAGFPLLESLNLSLMMRGLYKSAHPMRSPWSGYSGDIIRLAHLKYMRLVVDDDSDVGTFFSHIRAPPDTLIFMDISLTSEEELDALMRALTPYLRCATYDAIQLREDRTKGTRNFTIFTSAATSPSSSPQGVSLEFRLEENMWKRFISILPEYTDKDRIRHLDFARLSFLGNEAEVKYLRQAFQPFAFVRSVHMNIRMQGSSWDDGFLADFLAPRSGATNVKMFPILTDIAVTMTGVSSVSRAPFAKTWQQIIGALERRFSANGPLQRLAVSETWVKDGREDVQMREISHAARGVARLLVNELVDRC